MPEQPDETAHSLGLQIATARTAGDFDALLNDIGNLTPEKDTHVLAGELYGLKGVVYIEPLLVGAMRDNMTNVGSMALLLNLREQSVDITTRAQALNRFLDGLKKGGQPRRAARATVSSRLADTIANNLASTFPPALDTAKDLYAVGQESGVLKGRSLLEVRIAFLGHRIRRRASRETIKLALGTLPGEEITDAGLILPQTRVIPAQNLTK